MVDQLVHEGFSQWTDTELELHGKVMPHSIQMQVVRQQTTRSFVLAMNGESVRVFAKGPVPDTFTDESEIIATGYIVPAASEQATADAMGLQHLGDVGLMIAGLLAVILAAFGFILILREAWHGRVPARIVWTLAIAFHLLVLTLPLLFSAIDSSGSGVISAV